MRYILILYLTLMCICAAQSESAQTQPELIFQVGTFNEQDASSLFVRFWVKGGRFDSELSSARFGRIEFGTIKVSAPDGSLLFQKDLDHTDPRRVQSLRLPQAFQAGNYSASVAFIYRGELQQLEQVIDIDETNLIAVPNIRVDEISETNLSLSWDSVSNAQMYEVALFTADGQARALIQETLRNTEVVLELGDLNLDIEDSPSYRIVVTALSRAEPRSGLINGSSTSALVRLAQSEASTQAP